MNDAAELNNNIDSQAQAVDGSSQRDKHVLANNKNSRWWFASSAFPMIAGTLGPVASAFSICALVQYWRKHILPGSDVTKAVFDLRDPIWLTVINAIQLIIAIISNIFLLLNMAKRVRFSVAQPITIVGWYISAILLVALTSTASGSLGVVQPEIEYVWSQAFYYGIFAAILYFIVASLMVVTVWGAQSGHYRKDFELSVSQRTLMLQTILFLMYLLVGALVFSKIEEGWDYLDAVYWADVTLFTVGYGDFSPLSTLGRALLIPLCAGGRYQPWFGDWFDPELDAGPRKAPAGRADVGEGETAAPSSRQKEFELMRKIQNKASNRRRWTAMAVSLSTWLVLWLVGAKVFQECERPYQGWSYFDAFYFCFTGLTTIGYGDLTPVSNSGKAFFVFWSLLALPTMTVLISNAGTPWSKAIVGGLLKNVKIEERPPGFLGAAQPANSDEDEDEDDEDEDEDEDEDDIESDDSAEHGAGNASGGLPSNKANEQESPSTSTFSDLARGGKQNPTKAQKPPPPRSNTGNDDGLALAGRVESIAREDFPSELPTTRSEYHLVLIDEIARVTKHLQHSPPRKYTFKEWAWYLRLMGEDESSAETHKRPSRKLEKGKNNMKDNKSKDVISQHQQTGGGDSFQVSQGGPGPPSSSSSEQQPFTEPMGAERPSSPNADYGNKWSWVGHRSPLMDTREEAEWILDRLEQRLRAELLAVVEEKRGQRGVQEAAAYERKHEYHPKKKSTVVIGGD
ncbi:Two-pore potassium channel 4 [Apiospora phragmitis]|uniref:Two-pore potassium channel 4 n=1 Tax=Apiospora phragmitis TaxID=2905665 RepID=A0ABR1VET4_9PEZI